MTRPLKYCPFCGTMDIIYADDEVPTYAWCPTCETWVSAGDNFSREEIMYITQKLKSIRRMCEKLKEARV